MAHFLLDFHFLKSLEKSMHSEKGRTTLIAELREYLIRDHFSRGNKRERERKRKRGRLNARALQGHNCHQWWHWPRSNLMPAEHRPRFRLLHFTRVSHCMSKNPTDSFTWLHGCVETDKNCFQDVQHISTISVIDEYWQFFNVLYQQILHVC